MDVFSIYLSVASIVSITRLLFGSNPGIPPSLSIQEDEPIETIKFPETTNYTARIFAGYPNKTVLRKAKLLVNKYHPFHGAPHGGTYYIARKREYYLNQYLWFYEKYKRFPRNDELIAEGYFASLSRIPEVKPATWFTLTDKNELKAVKLFRERLHLWIALKKSSLEDSKKLIKRSDKVNRELTELFNNDENLAQRRSKGVNHAN